MTEELLGRLAIFHTAAGSRMESLPVQGLKTRSRDLRTLAIEDRRWAAMVNRRRGLVQRW